MKQAIYVIQEGTLRGVFFLLLKIEKSIEKDTQR